ncbi:MAG: tRNA (adenosine(37)-N6)-dimethylallyltransferase MiaA [Chryseotalea sp. WA131a]|nr:MAG: tRNA (adenosine(37)-N6)-dimethylallyltransferase MiaA [Chryseotalea sp. WA131a]
MCVQNRKLIVIVGPTAVGKTALAIRVAKQLKTEILSADSRQIYKELEIGTAKPTAAELAEVSHHFINSHSIQETFNAANFGIQASKLLEELFHQHEYVVVCGGSGLYIKGLLEGFDEMPQMQNGVREKIIHAYQQNGLAWLQDQVKKLDPAYFEIVDVQNPQRLMRALEVIESTDKPFTAWQLKSKRILPYQVIKIGLELERDQLYARIDARMDAMIEGGLFEEAAKFYPQKQLNALQTVGYKEIFDFMDGLYDKAEAVRLLKRNSRHYAKRQLTWFKRDEEIKWFGSADAAWEFLVSGN